MTGNKWLELKRGDIISNIGSANSYVVSAVHGNSGDGDSRELTLVSTVLASNPEEWMKTIKSESKILPKIIIFGDHMLHIRMQTDNRVLYTCLSCCEYTDSKIELTLTLDQLENMLGVETRVSTK